MSRRQGKLGCPMSGCELKIRSAGMCSKHLREVRESGASVPDLRLRENRPALPEVVCRIEGCGRLSKYRGQRLCQSHYLRRLTRGTFEPHQPLTREERLKAGIVSRDDCWIWGGVVASTGYGRIGSDYAHRVSHEVHIGPIPVGYQVDHLCRVRLCVNPAHLEAVTQQENLRRERAHNPLPARRDGKWVAA